LEGRKKGDVESKNKYFNIQNG
jgi:hypothetical protein